MFASLTATIDYIEASLKMVQRNPEGVTAMQEQQVNHLKLSFTRLDPTADDATRTLRRLAEPMTAFSQTQCQQLAAIVDGCVTMRQSGGGGSTPASGKKQTHLHIFNYLTDTDWSAPLSPLTPNVGKMEIVLVRCRSIGLQYPCEKTQKTIIGIIAACSPSTPSPSQRHALLKQYKSLKVLDRKAFPAVAVPVKVWPEDVSDYMKLFGDRYTEADPPVAPRVSAALCTSLAEGVPARGNSKLLIDVECKAGGPLLGAFSP